MFPTLVTPSSCNLRLRRQSCYQVLPLLTLIYFLLLHATPGQAQQGTIQNCSTENPRAPTDCVSGVTFLNSATGCCEPCSVCSEPEMRALSLCNVTHDAICRCNEPLYVTSSGGCVLVTTTTGSNIQDPPTTTQRPQTSNCIPGQTFLNSNGQCQQCSTCDSDDKIEIKSECNVTHDAVCRCKDPLFVLRRGMCYLDCRRCPTVNPQDTRGNCEFGSNPPRCACPSSPVQCYDKNDLYCRNPFSCNIIVETGPPTSVPTSTGTNPPPEGPDPLSPLGIGLIAIGVVTGIIIFASCFLCMGIFSIRRRKDPERQGSENSESGLVLQGSIGTNSTYLSSDSMYPYLSSHSMLELLKNSTPPLLVSQNGKPSSLHGSPLSIRASPNSGRTVKLMKNANDKLSAIVL